MDMYYTHRWVNESGNAADGKGLFGRKAQRKVVTQSLQSLVNSNQQIRETESRVFNLIATPGYPELVGEMKISACLSALARAFQHSPIRRFLALSADFEGKPHDARTRSGAITPCCLNNVFSSAIALLSHCSLVILSMIYAS